MPYQICISSCLREHSCKPDFGDVSWASFSCARSDSNILGLIMFRCRYKCVWETVAYFQQNNEDVPQFHGKWPFLALDIPRFGIFIQVSFRSWLQSFTGTRINIVLHS